MIKWLCNTWNQLKKNYFFQNSRLDLVLTCLSRSLNSLASCTVCSKSRTFHYWDPAVRVRDGGRAIGPACVPGDVTYGRCCGSVRLVACRTHLCKSDQRVPFIPVCPVLSPSLSCREAIVAQYNDTHTFGSTWF